MLRARGRNIRLRANGRNIVGCCMSRPFAHPVACCCMLLRVVAQSLKPVKLFCQQLPTFLLFRDRRSLAQQCWIRLRSSSNIVGATLAHYAWFTKTYGLHPSHDALQVPTFLGVVAPVCRPLWLTGTCNLHVLLLYDWFVCNPLGFWLAEFNVLCCSRCVIQWSNCMLTSVMVMFSVPGCMHGQTALHFSLFVLAFAFQLGEVEVDCCVVKLPTNVIPERGLVL